MANRGGRTPCVGIPLFSYDGQAMIIMEGLHTHEFSQGLLEEQLQIDYEWKDDQIQLICASAVPHHPAYGMSFPEYKKNRNALTSSDDVEKVRLSFRLTPFMSMVSSALATRHKLSHYRFLILVIELGMINFQKDYQDDYETIKQFRENMLAHLSDDEQSHQFMQLEKQTVDMGIISRTYKCFTPTVAEWLANTVRDTSVYLNMSTSDFVNLCWCLGIERTMPDVPPQVHKYAIKQIKQFDREFGEYHKRISQIKSGLEI